MVVRTNGSSYLTHVASDCEDLIILIFPNFEFFAFLSCSPKRINRWSTIDEGLI